MGATENKRIIEQIMEEVWNRGDLDKVEEYITDDSVEHNPYGELAGPEGMRQFVTAIHQTYDDFRIVAHNMIANDNFVSYNYTVEGTQTGSVGELEPTEKTVEIQGVYLARIENGKIVEAWNQFDVMSLLSQLGQLPEQAFVKIRKAQVSREERSDQEQIPEHRPRA